jgi:hypothetical protein
MVAISLFIRADSASSYGCVVSSGLSSWWWVELSIATSLTALTWHHFRTPEAPADLVTKIREAHAKDELIMDVSVSADGDWFLSTNAYNCEIVHLVLSCTCSLLLCS